MFNLAAGLALLTGVWLVPFAALFLFLDRLKPWPMAYVEQVPSGLGVMLDDLVPALLVGILFAAVQHVWNRRSA